MKTWSFLIVLMFFASGNVKSQGTEFVPEKNKYYYLAGSIGPMKTRLIYFGNDAITPLVVNEGLDLGASLEAGIQLSKWFGISTGIGIQKYTCELTLGDYSYSFDTTDTELQEYNRIIKGNTIQENQKVTFLNIPLVLHLHLPFNAKVGFFVQTGINFEMPIKTNYSSSGTFTYTGYYPDYNVLISDIPYEDFLSDYPVEKKGSLRIDNFCPELVTSAGFWLNLRNRYQISLGYCYNRILTDISDYGDISNYRLSTRTDHINSMMAGSEKITMSSMGVKITLRYIL